ncbi:MAG: CinA family protein [Gammaproteobacteria bacterium]
MSELNLADAAAEVLKANKQTIAVAESSTGGLISGNLLAVPGASAYYMGGTVIYTLRARRNFLGLDKATLDEQEPLSETYVQLCAERVRESLRSTWGIAELGATGPAGTPYGHPAGICVLCVSGPRTLTRRIETGHGDRVKNMDIFTAAAFELLEQALTD